MIPVVAGAVMLATTGTLPVFMLTAQSVLVTDDLGLTDAQLGMLVTVFYTASALSSIPTGRAAERLGTGRASRLAAGLAAVSLVGISLRPTSPVMLAVFLVLGAVGNSMSQAASNLLLARGTPARRQGAAFGVKQSAVPLAAAIGGAAVPTVGVSLGWRWGFVGAAVLAVLVALLVPRVCSGAEAARYRTTSRDGARPRLVGLRPLLLLGTATAFGSAAMGSLMAYLVIWANHSGMTAGNAGLLLSVAGVGSIVARVSIGFVADRRAGNNMAVVIGHVLLGVVGLCLIGTGVVPLIVLGAVLTISISWAWPGLMLFTVVRTNPSSPAAATGVIQMGAYTGNAVGPGLFGVLLTLVAFQVGWLVNAGLLVMAALLMAWARRLRLVERRRPEEPPTV
ncbi:MFS transporter [Microbispora sp. H10836]|uniref:MFS transporter n=1 Tax=Microbispora sp. H10836 TaxID=2729106 RepID=UPI001472C631|nr:MFS transporter [Microbispora sp. H10836]